MEEIESRSVSSETQEPAPEQDEGDLADIYDAPDQRRARPARSWGQLLRDVVETVVLTLVIFAVINVLTGRFRIEGPSMRPNLHEGQYIIIDKVTYRFEPPERGDIIVFHHPRNTGRDLIKRVIGLPRETVEIRQGQVYVDDTLLEEPYVLRPGRYSGHYELGPDEYFVLGDNRPNSDDSHNWGVLNREKIVGKAWISYWPPDEWGGVPHHSFSVRPTAQRQGLSLEAGAILPSSAGDPYGFPTAVQWLVTTAHEVFD